MPIIKKDSYELVVTFAGECNAALTVGGLTKRQANGLAQQIHRDWWNAVSMPIFYNTTRNLIVVRPSTIHALQVLQEVEYVTHPAEA